MSGSRFTGFRCVKCLRAKDQLVFADDEGTKYWFCIDCMKETPGLRILKSPYSYGRQVAECFECNKFGDSVPATKKIGEVIKTGSGKRRSKRNKVDVCEECFDELTLRFLEEDRRDDDDDNDYYDDQDFHDQRERMRDERF